MKKLLSTQILVLFAAALLQTAAQAATYTVTSTSWDGPGSLNEAIGLANANPGPDTIEFTPGLQVDARTAQPLVPSGTAVDIYEYSLAQITDEVVIDGKGGRIFGAMQWFNTQGVQSFGACPITDSNVIVTAITPGLFAIGTFNADNSAVNVTLRDLRIEEFNHVAAVQRNAALTMEDTDVKNIYTVWKCSAEGIIAAWEGADVTLRRSTFERFYNWINQSLFFTAAPIQSRASDTGDLTIENTRFAKMLGSDKVRPVTVYWSGAAGTKVNIVSSKFGFGTGGVYIDGETDANIVNSIWSNNTLLGPLAGDRFVNFSSGDMNIQASTLIWNSPDCLERCVTDTIDYDLFEIGANGGINFLQTAVGFNFPASVSGPAVETLVVNGTGSFSADEYTWIQPTKVQDAATLRTITSQPLLKTDPPAFDLPYFGAYLSELAHPTIGGVLIDQVPDAETGEVNQLLNPISALPLLEDVLGKPRVDANGTRNIGAVQLTLAPHLNATGIDGTIPMIRLDWTKPDALGLTGYEVCFGDGTPPDPVAIGNTCPGVLIAVGNTLTYDQLVAAGTTYWFLVRGVSGATLPWSNLAQARAFGDITAPVVIATPGDGEVTLTWTTADFGGRNFSAWSVLWRVDGATNFTGATATYSVGDRTVTVTGLNNGTAYEFAVAANAGNGVGPQGLVTATPLAPTAVTTTARFTVSKSYSDSNTTPVTVTKTCDDGTPLQQSFSISPGSPVTFTVLNFTAGATRCEITESGVPSGYKPAFDNGTTVSAQSCVFEAVLSDTDYSCTITNTVSVAPSPSARPVPVLPPWGFVILVGGFSLLASARLNRRK